MKNRQKFRCKLFKLLKTLKIVRTLQKNVPFKWKRKFYTKRKIIYLSAWRSRGSRGLTVLLPIGLAQVAKLIMQLITRNKNTPINFMGFSEKIVRANERKNCVWDSRLVGGYSAWFKVSHLFIRNVDAPAYKHLTP